MQIQAEVILDSISPSGKRITTFALTFPRFILPEFNTHRVFSRNARSTRAVPTDKLIKEVRQNPVLPCYYGKNKAGMQAVEELDEDTIKLVEATYRQAANDAADAAETLFKLGLHKQHAGRLLEPFMWTHVCVTATEWDNWFYLRDHPEAQPEIELLAKKMHESLDKSVPTRLEIGEWHLPYIRDDEKHLDLDIRKKISVARCARVSYKSFDGKLSTTQGDIELFEKLKGDPPHLSPLEHQATPDPLIEEPQLWGNFQGFVQYRKIVELW